MVLRSTSVIVVKATEGKAAPFFACSACGQVITRKGWYSWRWSEVGPDVVAAVSCWHPKCVPEPDPKDTREYAALEKLPEFLAHNMASWKLSRPPRAGHKGLPSEVSKKTASRAAVLLADSSEVQAETPPAAPTSAGQLPEPVPRTTPEPEPPKPTGLIQPCATVLRKGDTPWDPSTWVYCGTPSMPSKVWCFTHWQELFANPVLEKALHVRR